MHRGMNRLIKKMEEFAKKNGCSVINGQILFMFLLLSLFARRGDEYIDIGTK